MKILLIMFCIVSVFQLSATIINIPADQPTIQEGINVSVDGDTILVQPGDYQEIINFNGKNIVVGSLFLTTSDSTFIESTIIHYGTNSPYVVRFDNGENSSAQFVGFNLSSSSKGIHCEFSSPQIKYNYINVSTYGIRCDSLSAPIITNNIFENANRSIQISGNSSPQIYENEFYLPDDPDKCGIFVGQGTPIIENNFINGENSVFSCGIEVAWDSYNVSIIGNNISEVYYGIEIHGDTSCGIINNLIFNCSKGIMCNESDVRLINNTIVNNSDEGFLCSWIHNPEIINSIICGNSPNINYDAQIYFNNSCIEGGIPNNSIDLGGNTSRNPCFMDSIDFNLAVFSPCIDAGTIDTTGLNLPEFDLAGNVRIQDGNGDSASIIDIGCFESETITDPGYVSGTISLSGGTGNVEDVNVAIGAPVHPDENGDYLITIGTSASPYDVTAWLDNYLPETIQDVEVIAGEITENIDFDLEYYQPDNYLEFTPDSLFFITQTSQDFKIKNISLIDIYINTLTFANITGSFSYYPYNLTFPQHLNPNDSLECVIVLDLPTLPDNREILYDSLFVITDIGQFTVPIIWDSSLINDADDSTIQLSEINLSNFPNPFNPTTTIEFSIQNDSQIELSIFNIKGQKIITLANNEFIKGNHSLIWNGDDSFGNLVSSGVYLYKLKVNDKTEAMKKCLLLK
jgi:parallel beta-helix repeat protein